MSNGQVRVTHLALWFLCTRAFTLAPTLAVALCSGAVHGRGAVHTQTLHTGKRWCLKRRLYTLALCMVALCIGTKKGALCSAPCVAASVY